MSLPVAACRPAKGREPSADRDAPPIRVGFVLHAMHVAGAEMLVARLIRDLRDRIDATIFCLDAVGSLGSELADEGIEVVCLNRRPGRDWRLPPRLAAEVRRRQIEILHSHQYTPFFYAALARLCGARSARLIFTEHGRHYPDRVSIWRRLGNRWLLSSLASRINACCEFSAEALRAVDGFGHRIVDVIYNGIDVDEFSPAGDRSLQLQQLGLPTDRRYIAAVARLHPVKDHETLLRAFQVVARKIPDVDLLLVGDGPRRSELESLVKQLQLEERVRFLGVRADVAGILRAADLFALSSVSEAASLTLLEAMASERPVVVTHVGGNGELVRHGLDGWLTPRSDSQAMADALLDALNNPQRARTRAQSARERVCTLFQQRDTVQRFAKLYLELARPASVGTAP